MGPGCETEPALFFISVVCVCGCACGSNGWCTSPGEGCDTCGMRAARRLPAPVKQEVSAEPALSADEDEAPLSRTDSAAAWQKAEAGGIASTSVTVIPSRTSRLMPRFLPPLRAE